jgi:hypothetical protein
MMVVHAVAPTPSSSAPTSQSGCLGTSRAVAATSSASSATSASATRGGARGLGQHAVKVDRDTHEHEAGQGSRGANLSDGEILPAVHLSSRALTPAASRRRPATPLRAPRLSDSGRPATSSTTCPGITTSAGAVHGRMRGYPPPEAAAPRGRRSARPAASRSSAGRCSFARRTRGAAGRCPVERRQWRRGW